MVNFQSYVQLPEGTRILWDVLYYDFMGFNLNILLDGRRRGSRKKGQQLVQFDTYHIISLFLGGLEL